MAVLRVFEDNGKWGYKDADNRIVIPAIYDGAVRVFGADSQQHRKCLRYGTVCLNGKYGVINESGEVIVPIKYQEAYYLTGNFFAVRKRIEGKKAPLRSSWRSSWWFGVIDSSGKVVIPFEYSLIQAFDGFIQCCKGASSRLDSSIGSGINHQGHVYSYWAIDEEVWFNPSLEIIHEGKGIEAQNGFLVVENRERTLAYRNCSERDRNYFTLYKKSKLLGLKDIAGNLILPYDFNEIRCVTPNRIIVRTEGGRFGVYSNKGELIIPFDYEHITLSEESFFACWKHCKSEPIFPGYSEYSDNNKYEYSDHRGLVWHNQDGQFIAEWDGRVINSEMIAVNRFEKWGTITQSLQIMIRFEYDDIHPIDGALIVCKDKKMGVLNYSGGVIVDFKYDKIQAIQDALIVGRDGKMGILDKSGKVIISSLYTSIERLMRAPFHGVGLLCDYNQKFNFDSNNLDFKLRYRSRVLYRSIEGNPFIVLEHFYFDVDMDFIFLLSSDDHALLFTNKDGVINSSLSQMIYPISEQYYAVKRNSKWGIFNIVTKALVVKCQYDRVLFYGGNDVILYKDGILEKIALQ